MVAARAQSDAGLGRFLPDLDRAARGDPGAAGRGRGCGRAGAGRAAGCARADAVDLFPRPGPEPGRGLLLPAGRLRTKTDHAGSDFVPGFRCPYWVLTATLVEPRTALPASLN